MIQYISYTSYFPDLVGLSLGLNYLPPWVRKMSTQTKKYERSEILNLWRN